MFLIVYLLNTIQHMTIISIQFHSIASFQKVAQDKKTKEEGKERRHERISGKDIGGGKKGDNSQNLRGNVKNGSSLFFSSHPL